MASWSTDFISVLGIAVPLIVGVFGWRRRELRREEVLAWASQAIDSLETVVLLCIHMPPGVDASAYSSRRDNALFEIPCLVERGRMFFKNQVINDWGEEKPPAYRGYRPKILDSLVISYQVLQRLPGEEPTDRLILKSIALKALQEFVSLAQKEVGRARTVAKDTAKGGQGIDLSVLMRQEANRLGIARSDN